jgi:UDP-N-acetylmuramyl tripeptide synthase
MGAIADAAADHVVLTNDNPRGEPAEAIADAVQSGAAGRAEWARELDRAEAICHAVRWARPVDVVVIAGKGHETYQELAGARIPFSDREVARAALRACR